MDAPSDPWSLLLPIVDRLARVEHGAADAIDAWLQGKPVSVVLGIDRALRDRARHRAVGLPFADIEPERVRLWADRSGALGVLSCLRSGWVRQAATFELAQLFDRWSTAFLLARLGDPVLAVAQTAERGLRARAERGELLVACLPLLDAARARVRAPTELLLRLEASVRRARAALAQAQRSGDSSLALAASVRLAALARGTDGMLQVLQAALGDPHPRVRRWAAEVAMDRDRTPESVRSALLPQLAADRSPGVRRIAVRAASREGRVDLLVGAALDSNAEVRYQARRKLRRRENASQLAERARAVLADPDAPRRALVGALAALSDVGRAGDVPLVERFQDDPRPSVAREARRALPMLASP